MFRQKNACQAVLESELEDLQNEVKGFKKQISNVFRKYDKNFWEIAVSEGHSHQGWVAHKAAISLINERCTCGKEAKEEEDFQSLESTVSSPSPVGTPVLPEPVPLQVIPTFQVGWVTQRSFGNASDLFITDASSSGRGPASIQS